MHLSQNIYAVGQSAFQSSVVKPKAKQSQWPLIQTKEKEPGRTASTHN